MPDPGFNWEDYLAEGAPTRQAAPTGSNFDWEGYLGGQSQGTSPAPSTGGYGPGSALMTGLTLNTIPTARASARANAAVKAGGGSDFGYPTGKHWGPFWSSSPDQPGPHGEPSWNQVYQPAFNELNASREAYNTEHPLLGPGLELAGSIAPSIAAAALQPEIGGPALLGRLATAGARGAEIGAVQTPLTGGDVAGNALTGAVVGSAFPLAGAALRPAVDPLVAQTARAAEALGVKLRPGQFAMSSTLSKLDKLLASGGDTAQLKDFTRAFSHTIGEDTDALTSDVVDRAFDRVGQDLNDVATKTQAKYDRPFHNALAGIERRIGGTPGMEEADRKSVSAVIEDIRKTAASGMISGDDFQALTKRGSMLSNLSKNGNADVRRAGGDIVDSLFDVLGRHSPADQVERLTDLRDQFKTLKLAEGLANKAGPSGLINPKDLASAMSAGRVSGDVETLAKAGKFLPSPTASGTAKPQYAHLGPLSRIGLSMAGLGAGAEAFHELGLAADPKALAIALGAVGGALALRSGGKAVLQSSTLRNAALGIAPPNWATGLATAGKPLAIGGVNELGAQRPGQ